MKRDIIIGPERQRVDVILRNKWRVLIRMVWGGKLVFAVVDNPTWYRWRV